MLSFFKEKPMSNEQSKGEGSWCSGSPHLQNRCKRLMVLEAWIIFSKKDKDCFCIGDSNQPELQLVLATGGTRTRNLYFEAQILESFTLERHHGQHLMSSTSITTSASGSRIETMGNLCMQSKEKGNHVGWLLVESEPLLAESASWAVSTELLQLFFAAAFHGLPQKETRMEAVKTPQLITPQACSEQDLEWDPGGKRRDTGGKPWSGSRIWRFRVMDSEVLFATHMATTTTDPHKI
ncbi:hypothetical protein AAES_134401 [Amazona aestiva]|uniref:Uncharacterized protein n=1 Tax=Amazona aestiva TaxID=12930 RepID=A0A0Q3T7I9_AMAAE|nr:hypothetical protein AAES_134401 [Amazona aestiva]